MRIGTGKWKMLNLRRVLFRLAQQRRSHATRRNLRDVDGVANNVSRSSRKARPAGRLQQMFILTTLVSVTIILAVCTTVFHPVVENIALKMGYREPVFAVIIDAGSTGSRVLAYTFHKSYIGGRLVIEGELYKEVEPGLSSYVDNPPKGAESIMKLVADAYTVVPEESRASTPLLLRATAGLRLLDPVAADRLLDAVRGALRTSGFKVGEDSVEIMDGADEGVNSWFTVNFLLDRLSSTDTIAALDLGGGSTQVTYEPVGDGIPGPLISFPGPDRNISLFTHSYLNLGLMAARRGVLLTENPADAIHLVSECINPIIKDVPWRYANVNYFVSGPKKDVLYKEVKETQDSVSERMPVVRYDRCKELVVNLVKRMLISAPVPTKLEEHSVSAFSYYFDRAADAGLIDPIEGGTVSVQDFTDASVTECAVPNADQPWVCFDLTFISVLLEEAFHLAPDKKIELVNKIKGHEISWALGLAYNTLLKNS